MKILKLSLAALLTAPLPAAADGMVSTIVNAPLSATGTVKNARVGINVYLQTDAAQGAAFMDPNVIGYGIPAGGRMEIEMGGDYERDWAVGLSQASIMLVTGTPQQGLPGAKVGYEVSEGDEPNIFVITPTNDTGMVADTLMTPAPGAKGDPVRQRGLKVIHIGFQQSAFLNSGENGAVTVRILDANGDVASQGTGSIDFIDQPVAQILPTNFPDKRRNHNWQHVHAGDVVGKTPGTLPLTFMLYGAAPAGDTDAMYAYKGGLNGVGAVSSATLAAMGYDAPGPLSRYDGGLLIQDSNNDGKLDPAADLIVGGVINQTPAGAGGQEIGTIETDNGPLLSRPTADVAAKPGKRWGGSMLQLQYKAGSAPGVYRTTLALLKDPADPAQGDGSAYTYTIVVE